MSITPNSPDVRAKLSVDAVSAPGQTSGSSHAAHHLPGSTGACKAAWDTIIATQLD